MADVLDVCCGIRMMWLDKENPRVIYGDNRTETLMVTDRSIGNKSGKRILRISPDVQFDFRCIPFPDESFPLVVFDPPHMIHAGPRSWLAGKYGLLSKDWKDDIRSGFQECFRVLKSDGVLVFKWNESQVKLKDILALCGKTPLFGQVSGRKGMTHWLVFMKEAMNG